MAGWRAKCDAMEKELLVAREREAYLAREAEIANGRAQRLHENG